MSLIPPRPAAGVHPTNIFRQRLRLWKLGYRALQLDIAIR
jgi:hypothetical protein